MASSTYAGPESTEKRGGTATCFPVASSGVEIAVLMLKRLLKLYALQALDGVGCHE
jgi:hypothetical protein